MRSWGLARKRDNARKQIRLERFAVLGTCIMGASPQFNSGEQHDQRADYKEIITTCQEKLCQRARLVFLLHTQPLLSHVEAASQVSLHPDSVRHWQQRWAPGDFCLDDEPGRGRHPRFSPLDPALVKAMACELVAESEQPLRWKFDHSQLTTLLAQIEAQQKRLTAAQLHCSEEAA